MKRNAFIKHLKINGCVLAREGANHSLYINPINGKKSIPSTRESTSRIIEPNV